MSKFDDKHSMPRYRILAWCMVLLAVGIVCRAAYIMTVKKSYWDEVAARLTVDSVAVKPTRGNILSSEGDLLASTLPEYKLYIDFKAMHDSKTDTLWAEKEDSICRGLAEIFPTMTAQEFREHLREGRQMMSRNWPIWKRRVSYSVYSEVAALPILRLRPFQGGFHVEKFNARRMPNGSLASRTIGFMYGEIDSARCGLEQYYDDVLRGEDGLKNRRKVLNKYLDIPLKDPVDGADIITTLDVSIQDLAERAVIDELKEIGGELGVAIVMEVKTGDIKALVNMSHVGDGQYREIKNNAVSDLVEPGSVFKTASIMVGLEDGKFDTSTVIQTAGGVWPMYGREMRDHNWRRGGYGDLTVSKVLHYSSNVGVSRLIDNNYKNNPQKFIDGLRKLGFGTDFNLPFKGAAPHAKVLGPEERKQIRGGYWSHTTLPWMSIGYETQVPPIFTVAFYNAIANNGRLMEPRFVKRVEKNGEVLQEFEPVCKIEHICSDKTLHKIQAVLEGVVSQGLGKKAGSKSFRVAGKTGTAQIADQTGKYGTGAMRYWLSFAGYFPYDNPEYTCIVCLKKTGLPASGGGMCGKVFHEISEGIMAKRLKQMSKSARDEHSILVPEVKAGNLLAADYVLSHLGLATTGGWNGTRDTGAPVWGRPKTTRKSVELAREAEPAKGMVPDVSGMGARDAVYKLENLGLKVDISGRGKVRRQSIAPHTRIHRGMRIRLELA